MPRLRMVSLGFAIGVATFLFGCQPRTAAPGPVTVDTMSPPARTSGKPAYVTAAQFDFKAILPGPPADDSDAHRAEVDRMLSMQADRTAAQEERCRSQEQVNVFAFAEV